MVTIELSRKNIDYVIVAVLFLLTIGIRLYDINGAGGTFDEYDYFANAASIEKAVSTFDFSKDGWSMFAEHPPIGKYVHALFYSPVLVKMSDQEKDSLIKRFAQPSTISGESYTLGRYSSVLYEGLTVVVVYLFCLIFLSRTTGMIAGSILALLPEFIAYGKIANLDPAVAFFFTLGAFFFALAIKYDTWKWWRILGIVTGLAIAAKFNLALLLPFYCLVFLVWKGPEIWKNTKHNWNKQHDLSFTSKRFIKDIWYWKLFFVPVIAVAVLYIVWPWLWGLHPISQIEKANMIWNGGLGVSPWFGKMIGTENNYAYFFVYLLFTTPVLILLLFFISMYNQWKNRKFWNYFILLWFIIPLVISSFSAPLKHNGVREIIMVFPPLAILAAQGLQHLLKDKKKLLYGTVIVLVYLIAIDIWIHPYYLDYYNSLIGGSKNVEQKNLLEFDWYAEGKREAVQWLDDNAVPNSVIGMKWNPEHDAGGFRPDLKAYNLIYVNFTGEPGYLMINHRYYQYDEYKDPVKFDLSKYSLVHTIKAGNGDIGWIYRHY